MQLLLVSINQLLLKCMLLKRIKFNNHLQTKNKSIIYKIDSIEFVSN